MAQAKPTYHLPPNFSTPPPPKGPFHLGTVIRDFDRGEQMRPLNHGKDKDGKDKRIVIDKDDIYLDHKGGFVATRWRLKSGEFGLWAKFVGMGGLGGEATVSAKRNENDTYRFDSVDTEYIYPSPSYVSQCMGLSDVEEYVKATMQKKAVYLVTGLKVAKGAAVRMEANSELTGKLNLGLKASGGFPVQLGPHVGGKSENKPVGEFEQSNDIVVGIQCLKIYHKSGFFGGEKRRKDEVYTDGATFFGDEANSQRGVSVEDLIIVGPESNKNPKFSAHYQAFEEGKQDEVWMLPTGSD